jgi:hypothetical protein
LTNPATLNAVGATVVLNQDSSFNSAGQTMAWGQNAGTVSTLTLNDTASLSANHLQVGKISQGIVNQNGGTVTLTGDLRLGLDAGAATASRYNLAAGTVTAAGAFSVGGTDAGADGGTYFNFTADSTGSLVSSQSVEQLSTKIDAGQIRVADVAYTSSDAIWLMDSSVPGQTTLSLDPNPLVTQLWKAFPTNTELGNNSNWIGAGNPTGDAATLVGVIDGSANIQPSIQFGGQLNATSLVLNNGATLTNPATLNAVGATVVLNQNSSFNSAGQTMAWGQNAGTVSTLTLNDTASLSALHLQVGRLSQGIVNQNGGTVTLTGDLRLGLDAGAASASRYNLAAGTVTAAGTMSAGGTDAGADGGTYFNFTAGSTGILTIGGTVGQLNTRIDNGWIRFNDTEYASGDAVWSIVDNGGSMTLSVIPEPSASALFVGISLLVVGIARRKRA